MSKPDKLEVKSGVNIGIAGFNNIVMQSGRWNKDAEDEGTLPQALVHRYNSHEALVEALEKVITQVGRTITSELREEIDMLLASTKEAK